MALIHPTAWTFKPKTLKSSMKHPKKRKLHKLIDAVQAKVNKPKLSLPATFQRIPKNSKKPVKTKLTLPKSFKRIPPGYSLPLKKVSSQVQKLKKLAAKPAKKSTTKKNPYRKNLYTVDEVRKMGPKTFAVVYPYLRDDVKSHFAPPEIQKPKPKKPRKSRKKAMANPNRKNLYTADEVSNMGPSEFRLVYPHLRDEIKSQFEPPKKGHRPVRKLPAGFMDSAKNALEGFKYKPKRAVPEFDPYENLP